MTPKRLMIAASLCGILPLCPSSALAQTAPLPGLMKSTEFKSSPQLQNTPVVTTGSAAIANSGQKSNASTSRAQQKPAADAPEKNANRPHPILYVGGCTQTFKRRSIRLLKDPCVIFFPIVHPLRASKYAEEHGISAALGIGTMAASSVAAVRK